MVKTISSEKELPKLAQEILNFAEDCKIFVFKGNLGTGKTTFIKEICKTLGVLEKTSSPTYSIVNEYLAINTKIYHIDLYRLNNLDEAFEVGLEDYLESGNYCFIEWPEIIKPILPDSFIDVSIQKKDAEKREFKIIKS